MFGVNLPHLASHGHFQRCSKVTLGSFPVIAFKLAVFFCRQTHTIAGLGLRLCYFFSLIWFTVYLTPLWGYNEHLASPSDPVFVLHQCVQTKLRCGMHTTRCDILIRCRISWRTALSGRWLRPVSCMSAKALACQACYCICRGLCANGICLNFFKGN